MELIDQPKGVTHVEANQVGHRGGRGRRGARARRSCSRRCTQSAPIKAPVPAAAQEVKAPDTDNVQSGDQTTPDSPATAARAHSSSTSPAGNEAPGNENAPEAAGNAAEAPSNENAPSDGPGGHADSPGNVDNQQQGQN